MIITKVITMPIMLPTHKVQQAVTIESCAAARGTTSVATPALPAVTGATQRIPTVSSVFVVLAHFLDSVFWFLNFLCHCEELIKFGIASGKNKTALAMTLFL